MAGGAAGGGEAGFETVEEGEGGECDGGMETGAVEGVGDEMCECEGDGGSGDGGGGGGGRGRCWGREGLGTVEGVGDEAGTDTGSVFVAVKRVGTMMGRTGTGTGTTASSLLTVSNKKVGMSKGLTGLCIR